MENKKSDPPVTRSEFFKETGSIRVDIKNLDDKLDKAVNRLAGEIVKTQTDFQKVEERIETKISTEISKVLGAIDAFAQKAENYDRKAVFHDRRINDHEERIIQLEKTSLS